MTLYGRISNQQHPAGHRAAETTVIDTIEAARAAGVEWLSLYAFSTENWNRPGPEISFLMRLVRLARGIRCRFLGVADPRIPRELTRDFDDLTTLTADNRGMTLTVAFDHGGRRDIVAAARSLIRSGTPAEEVTERLFAGHLPFPDTPDVDLVIRTSGEQRISNFMLWQVNQRRKHHRGPLPLPRQRRPPRPDRGRAALPDEARGGPAPSPVTAGRRSLP
ncbi:polyprenyl diphosphate synthase [Streptomyces sp. NPDC056568]|uniref:polyprenyl diphosphate synthase n=1 Tax=Streptomyces sp. NPDC056568 TaxID=3345866 RepID=UPI0036BF675F